MRLRWKTAFFAAMVLERLSRIRTRIEAAAARAGRDPAAVEIAAVVKSASEADVRTLLNERSPRWFAESRVQDAQKRRAALGPDAANGRWRFIGHLQTNKVKAALELSESIDSLDSWRLAEALDRRLAEAGQTREVLLQVKLTERTEQSGLSPEEAPGFLERLKGLPRLAPRGLMAIAPMEADAEALRPHFARMRSLFERCFPEGGTLSMGMSGDFEVAVEEGATLVRIGGALFSDRFCRTAA